MADLVHATLGMTENGQAPIENGPTRRSSQDALCRRGREEPDETTVSFTNLYRTSTTLLRLNHSRFSPRQPWNGGNWPSSRRERSNRGPSDVTIMSPG
jgi:hypothetical protein